MWHLTISGDISGCHNQGCYWHLVGRSQGCCKHPTRHGTAPTIKNVPAQRVSSAEFEKLCPGGGQNRQMAGAWVLPWAPQNPTAATQNCESSKKWTLCGWRHCTLRIVCFSCEAPQLITQSSTEIWVPVWSCWSAVQTHLCKLYCNGPFYPETLEQAGHCYENVTFQLEAADIHHNLSHFCRCTPEPTPGLRAGICGY